MMRKGSCNLVETALDPSTSPMNHSGLESWLMSPARISFSTGFVDANNIGVVAGAAELSAAERHDVELWRDADLGADFQFNSMAATSTVDRCWPGGNYMFKPADELFHKGKLRPLNLDLQLPASRNQVEIFGLGIQELLQPAPSNITSVPNVIAEELRSSTSTSSATRSRMSLKNDQSAATFHAAASSPDPSVPKSPRWREVFGLLRRARSDGGRCRPTREPPEKVPPSRIPPPLEHPDECSIVEVCCLQSSKMLTHEGRQNILPRYTPIRAVSSAPFGLVDRNVASNPLLPVSHLRPSVLSAGLQVAESPPIPPSMLETAEVLTMESKETQLSLQAVPRLSRLRPSRDCKLNQLGAEGNTSSVRVTPVLNVPQLCIGQAAIMAGSRSSSSSSSFCKGRLLAKTLRSFFLFFKKDHTEDFKPPLTTAS
ncbi:unnamed protein product [Sphagnum troendelagicum]|uniref:Uncharacterized protein n=1 Tax=Sphagnum troendelagicum TaxID=128251 RepID=A0ABP0U2Y4_9BRYO